MDKRSMFDNDSTGCAPIILVVGGLLLIVKILDMLPEIIEAIKK